MFFHSTALKKRKISAGFTLIEVLLVIAIVLTVGFLSGAFPTRMIRQSAVTDAAEELKGALYKAQVYSLSGKQNSSWGVHFSHSNMTLFKGDSYASRDASSDENTSINENISVSGFSEAVFARPEGKPQAPISQITLSWSGETENISLNEEGIIE